MSQTILTHEHAAQIAARTGTTEDAVLEAHATLLVAPAGGRKHPKPWARLGEWSLFRDGSHARWIPGHAPALYTA